MLRTILLEPMFNVLLALYVLIPGGDFGVAVIVLTVIIRIFMWPLVRKQVRHQQAMRIIQPKLDKINKKYKDDQQKRSEKMLELFKKEEVNPFAPFGIILIQMPILITLFFVLREIVNGDTVGDTAYSFIASLPAVDAIISNPEAFEPSLFGLVNMAESSLVIAVLAGGAQYIQARQMSPAKSDGDDNKANMQRNMVKFLPLITVGVASQFPAALALYWTVSSLVAIVQQKILIEETTLLGLIGLQSKPEAKDEEEKPQSNQKPKSETPKSKETSKPKSNNTPKNTQNQSKNQSKSKTNNSKTRTEPKSKQSKGNKE